MSFIASTGIINLDILYGNIPHVPKEGTELFSKNFDIQLGGGAAASMINLSRLGVNTKLITLLGPDTLSTLVKDELIKYEQPYINIYNGSQMPITVTSVMITEKDRTFISYRNDIIISDEMKKIVYEQCKGAKIIQMQEGYEDVYSKIKSENPNTIFVYDTGWAENLSIERYESYLNIADYFTPSLPEALKITNTNNIYEAASILHRFFDDVIIKLDNKGCFVSTKEYQCLIPPLGNIKAVDSTGAGDAFLSGIMYGLYHDNDILESVIYGNIFGGYCVKSIGCLSSYPSKLDLELNKENIERKIKYNVSKGSLNL